MRRLFTPTIALAIVALVAASPLLAASFDFKLSREATINGTRLEPGTYKLELNGESEALIYRNKELVTKAPVTVKPRTNGTTRASVLVDSSGNVLEVRTKKQVVVFAR
jgi:hypothetical protein